MTKPITMQKAMRFLNATATLSTTEIFIQYVNTKFVSKAAMLAHRCSPEMGHFYSVSLDLAATPEECLAIEDAFRPGWKAVKVVYWQGRLSISLACHESPEWAGFYNGKPLSTCV